MDYDVVCINCLHKTHEGKECPYCPLPTKENPNSRCKEFTRADIFVARSIARLEQGIGQAHGQLMMGLSTIFDLLAEAYPEAADRLKARLEEQRAKAEAEMKAQQEKAGLEADEAFKLASAAREEQAIEGMVEEEYQTKTNLLKFPKVIEDPTNAPEAPKEA